MTERRLFSVHDKWYSWTKEEMIENIKPEPDDIKYLWAEGFPPELLEHKAPDYLWGEPQGKMRSVVDIVQDITGNFDDDAHDGGSILHSLHDPLACGMAIVEQLDAFTNPGLDSFAQKFTVPVIQAVIQYGMRWSHRMYADYRDQSIYLSEVGDDKGIMYQIMEELINEALDAYINNEWKWGEDGDIDFYDQGKDAYGKAIEEIHKRCFRFETSW